jgi:hypothetical protein
MKVKELLLNCKSFLTLLKEFAIEAKDVVIKDEKLIFTDQSSTHQDAVQETICIEAKNKNTAYNFFGVLHYNFLNNLAVFEMQGFEKIDDFIDS